MKLGYKRTEVGVIPVDWEVKPLVDLNPFVTSGSRGWATFYADRGSFFVRITNMSRDCIYLDLRNQKFVNLPAESSEGIRTKLQEHDVLISITADIGIISYIDSDVPAPAYINQHIALVRFDQAWTCGKFVSYFLASEKPQKLFRASTDTGAKAGMSLQTVQKIEVALPSLPEQHAIAKALSDVDALLGGLERLLIKKWGLKQAAMQQLLTCQIRLPGFTGEWDMRPLKEIVQTPITDGPHLTPRFYEDGVPFLSVNNLVDNKISLEDLRFISKQDHEVFSRKCKPRKNDILLGKAASVGKVAIVEQELEFNIWSPIAMIRVSNNQDPRFIYYQLQSSDIVRQIALLTNSSSQGNIGMGDIEKLHLLLPPLLEQTTIAAVLSDMDAELAALEARRDKVRDLKQAMMQELLTGKTRLVSPEVPYA